MSRVLKSVNSSEYRVQQIPVTDAALPEQSQATHNSGGSSTDADARIDDAQAYIVQARETAAAMIEDAKQQQQQILQEVATEADAIRQQASEEGYAAGFAAGEAAAREASRQYMDEQVSLAQHVLEQAQARYETVLHRLPSVVVGVVSEALHTLLQRELMVASVEMETIVRTMLESVEQASRVEVHVNPGEFEEAMARDGHWLTQSLGEWYVTVLPDTDIRSGGCVIRTPNGRVDGRIETRLELVRTALTELLERETVDELASEGRT